MRVTILGAGGFVGSHLVEHLGPRHRVLGLDVTDEKLRDVDADFEFREVDIRHDEQALEEAIRTADVVIDLVAYANPSLYVETPLEVFELNFTQNLKVAELCAAHRRWLVQYSSAEVYGKARDGTRFREDETDFVLGPVTRHRWIYPAAKALLERVLHAHGLEGSLDYTIIRPFNFIGSRIDYLVPPGSMGGPRVFAHFMSALLGGGPMYVVDGGHVHRAFLHIEDANRALETILERREASRNQIFNVGNPDNDLVIRDLAALMRELYVELTGQPSSSPIVEVSGEEFYGAGYEDADRLPPDITKLRRLGWAPRHGIRETFRHAMAYYLENPPAGIGVDRVREPTAATA